MLELFRSRRRAIVWFVEASLLAMLVLAATAITVGWSRALDGEQMLRAAAIALVVQASLYYHGLYDLAPVRGALALFRTVFSALVVAGLALWALFLLAGDRRFFGYACALAGAALLLPAWRMGLQRVAGLPRFRQPTLVLGAGPLAQACVDLVRGPYDTGLVLAGRLVPAGDAAAGHPDVLGTMADLPQVVAERGIRHIVVACAERRGQFPLDALLELKFRGVEIEEGINFYERIAGKLFVRELRPSQLIFADGFHVGRATLVKKRVLDVVLASVGLVLSAPLMLLTAIAIKLDSRGPILYAQERCGAFGQRFTIFKFRSMRVDAEADGRARWAAERDPRVTRVGRFIRKSRLDELPQLWNVLLGEMSLVGPRPERPVFVEELEKQIPYFHQRLFVKPGVTGYAQVRCRYGASTEDQLEKLQYDLFYIKSLSLWFDLSILFDTVKVVLLRIGSR
jgi:sugar transferase (PEP-CTERM system associated)